MADIKLGTNFKLYYNKDTGNSSPQGIGNVLISELAAFPVLTISSEASKFDTYDSDYVSTLLSDMTVEPMEIVVNYIPTDSTHQFLDQAALDQTEFQLVLVYSFEDGEISYAISNGAISAYTVSGDKDSVVQKTYTFNHTQVMARSMVANAVNPLYQGDYGVGSDGVTIPQYTPVNPTGNSFIKIPSTQSGNPASTDMLGIGLVDNGSVCELAITKSGTLGIYAKNSSTAWTRIYTATQMDARYVVQSTTINGKPLSGNVVLSASDLAGGTMTGGLTVPALKVTGDTTLSGNTTAAAVTATSLTSTGSTTTASLSVLGDTSTGTMNTSTLNVSGTTKLTGVTTADTVNAGNTSASSLAVSGDTTLSGITTASTVNASDLSVSGTTTADVVDAGTLNVSGDVTLAGTTDTGDLTVSGTTTLNGVTTAGTINASDLTLTNALPVTQGGTGNSTGNAPTAMALKTARKVVIDLTSTTATTFDGTSDIKTGVDGILPVSSGGTAATDADSARLNLVAAKSGANGDITSLSGLTTALSTSQGGTGNTKGTVGQLTTPRTFITDLGSTTAVSFDATKDASVGITGVLSLSNGGTGASTADTARSNLAAAKSGANSDITSLAGLTTALSTSQGGTGNANGTVGQLTTARTFVTNLASTTAASFNGTANVTPGVTGILPLANGGTGLANPFGTAAGTFAQGNDSRLNTIDGKTGGSINGALNISNGLTVNGMVQTQNGYFYSLQTNNESSGNVNNTGLRIAGTSTPWDLFLQYYLVTGSYHCFRLVQNSSETFRVQSNGYTYATSFNPTSDSNLKFNKSFLINSLENTMQIRGMSYDLQGSRKAGVIAQDVEKFMPEAVSTNVVSVVLEDGTILEETKSLDYSAITGLHTEALKDVVKLMLECLTDPQSAKTKLTELAELINTDTSDENQTDLKMEWALVNQPTKNDSASPE